MRDQLSLHLSYISFLYIFLREKIVNSIYHILKKRTGSYFLKMLRSRHWEPHVLFKSHGGTFVHREWWLQNSSAEYQGQTAVSGTSYQDQVKAALVRKLLGTQPLEVRPGLTYGLVPLTSSVQERPFTAHVSQCITVIRLLTSWTVWAHGNIYITARSRHEAATRPSPLIAPWKHGFQITAFCVVCWVCRTNSTLPSARTTSKQESKVSLYHPF